MTTRVSIIVPCRNDAAALHRTLDCLAGLPGIAAAEVIVAAAGDPAGTTRAAAGRARVLWPGGSTRAALMNAGAKEARGDVLFFLHADSFPPPAALSLIQRCAVGSAGGGRRVRASVRRAGLEPSRHQLGSIASAIA